MRVTDKDKEFLEVFSTWYPYERYILKRPASLDTLFGDMRLVEIFMVPVENQNIDPKNVYIRIVYGSTELQFALFDCSEDIRDFIYDSIIADFGAYEWECLYVEHEDRDSLNDALRKQASMILLKYDFICNLKKNFDNIHSEEYRNLITEVNNSLKQYC